MKISIITPLYNAGKYLKEFLDSVLGQVFGEFELLCIDDCSDDGTLEILQAYRKLDERIKIFTNKQHSGAAYSRNRGLEEAEGEYLFFLDGDDIFDEEMLYLAYHKAVETGADIVEFQSFKTTSDQIHSKRENQLGTAFVKRYCARMFSISELKASEYLIVRSSPCEKIYRRDFISQSNLKFQDLPCCNDVFFVNMALLMAEKIIWLETNKVLLYVREHKTPGRISVDRDPMCAYYADRKILEELMARGAMESLYRQCYTRIYFHLNMALNNTRSQERAEQFYTFLQREGIWSLQEIGGKYYENLDGYVKEGFDRYINESYESGWYKEVGELQAHLQDNLESIQALFKEWKEKGKKVGLWGVGLNGKIFLQFCHQYHIELDQIMDYDERKRGKSILNFPSVCSPDVGSEKVEVIIFTNKNILKEAGNKLAGSETELIDINSYLGVY